MKFNRTAAQKWASIVEWVGFWEAAEIKTRQYRSHLNAALWEESRSDVQTSSQFHLRRATEGVSWNPGEGQFEWEGKGVESWLSTEASAASGANAHDTQTTGAGRTRSAAVSFRIKLKEGEATFGPGANEQWPEAQMTGWIGVGENRQNINRTNSLLRTHPVLYKGERRSGWWEFGSPPGVITFNDDKASNTQHDESNYGYEYRGRVILCPVYDNLECEVVIDGYAKWLPRGNIEKPLTPGSKLQARATLIAKGESAKSPPKVKHFKFELTDVSHEPGVCMNGPLFGKKGDAPPEEDKEPDLRFSDELAHSGHDTTSAVIEPINDAKGRQSATARIDCYDFGGYATLRVTCVLEDEREIVGILRQQGEDIILIPLPWRQQGSKIAQAWAEKVKMTGSDRDDLDAEPVGNGMKGDGFSNYEEYRGFAEYGGHIRTKPGQKDLFIRNKEGKRLLGGIFLYADLTQLAVHYELSAAEMPESRRMNLNRSSKSPRSCAPDQFQHGLILDRISKGTASVTEVTGALWRPQYVSSVRILTSLFRPGAEGMLDSTVAHELLHATGVYHHGEGDDYVAWKKNHLDDGSLYWFEEQLVEWSDTTNDFVEAPGRPTVFVLFDWDGNRIPATEGKFLEKRQIIYLGHHQQQHSGDVHCVMRYDCAAAFQLPRQGGSRFLSPGEPTGMGICSSSAGTEFNTTNPAYKFVRYAEATRGDCVHKFCVRDDAPNPP